MMGYTIKLSYLSPEGIASLIVTKNGITGGIRVWPAEGNILPLVEVRCPCRRCSLSSCWWCCLLLCLHTAVSEPPLRAAAALMLTEIYVAGDLCCQRPRLWWLVDKEEGRHLMKVVLFLLFAHCFPCYLTQSDSLAICVEPTQKMYQRKGGKTWPSGLTGLALD